MRRVLVGLSVAILALAFAGSAFAGAQEAELFNHTNSNCANGDQNVGFPQPGFAIINGTASDIIAEVHLTGAPPDATYTVSLDQTPSQSGCVTTVTTLTTNVQGIGNAYVDVPRLPGTTGALVFLRPNNAAAAVTGEIDSKYMILGTP